LAVLALVLVALTGLSCTEPELPPEPDRHGFPACSGAELSFIEVEPNNGTTQADVNVVTSADGALELRGTAASCANDGSHWTGDVDVFEVSYGCGGAAALTLSWESPPQNPADLDFTVFAPELSTTNYAAVGYEWSSPEPATDGATDKVFQEEHQAELGGPLLISVMCWSGPEDQEWSFRIDWLDSQQTDDDDSAAGDDDDSAAD
tara:strand:+ start:696 stop:1310 length:615 start_codon:yes stop_codon:yes gene_type:complete